MRSVNQVLLFKAQLPLRCDSSVQSVPTLLLSFTCRSCVPSYPSLFTSLQQLHLGQKLSPKLSFYSIGYIVKVNLFTLNPQRVLTLWCRHTASVIEKYWCPFDGLNITLFQVLLSYCFPVSFSLLYIPLYQKPSGAWGCCQSIDISITDKLAFNNWKVIITFWMYKYFIIFFE